MPIASPIIADITQPLYSDTNNKLVVSGSAIPNTIVILTVTRVNDGFVAANGTATVDSTGKFAFNFEDHFNNGSYKITARTQDDRNALSLPVDFPLTVKSKPVLIIGALELSFNGLVLLLLIILLASFFGGYYFYKFKGEKSERKMIIAKRDLLNISDILRKDVDIVKRNEQGDEMKRDRALKELNEIADKIDTYIKKEVEDIRK